MTYKHIAFLLPLLATSLGGGQIGAWKAPLPLAVSAPESSQLPIVGLLCPLDLDCGDSMNATVSITQLLGATRITVASGSSRASKVVSGSSSGSVTLTVECDGQDVDVTVGTSASRWSAVTSCGQVGVE
jgi:hypothetical protein